MHDFKQELMRWRSERILSQLVVPRYHAVLGSFQWSVLAYPEYLVRLKNFWEKPLDGLPVQPPPARLVPGDTALLNEIKTKGFAVLPYHMAHVLEQRPFESNSGVWGIDYYRADHRIGTVPLPMLSETTYSYEDVSPSVFEAAKKLTIPFYSLVTNPDDVIGLLPQKVGVKVGLEISEDWYDPQNGDIPELAKHTSFIESHAVELIEFDSVSQRFHFLNTWGEGWGDEGWGTLPLGHWNTAVFEPFACPGRSLLFATNLKRGVGIRGWKWDATGHIALYGREIFDAATNTPLAWAYCIRNGSSLDLQELFVWPSERGKGYGKRLASLAIELAQQLKLPLRQVVTFADTEPYALSGAEATARMLGLKLAESPYRWASLIGEASPKNYPARNWKPRRPASILEALRSSKEPPHETATQYPVFFGTNRLPVNLANLSDGFSEARGDKLHRGYALVEIAKSHKFGTAGRTWLRLFKPADAKENRVVFIQQLLDDFWPFAKANINKHEASQKQNLLYIHGYRNSFNDALLRAAQLAVDLKIQGAAFAFSWPSSTQYRKYPSDETSVEASLEFALDFVRNILTECPEIPLNIVAHSMGNRLALRLMERLAREENAVGKIGQLLLAAPDVDSQLFQQLVPRICNIPKRISCYCCSADYALQLSEWFHSYPRVGLVPPICTVEGVDTIYVEDFNLLDFLGHGYYAESGAVVGDMFNLIRFDSSPEDRPGTRRKLTDDDRPYWRLSMTN